MSVSWSLCLRDETRTSNAEARMPSQLRNLPTAIRTRSTASQTFQTITEFRTDGSRSGTPKAFRRAAQRRPSRDDAGSMLGESRQLRRSCGTTSRRWESHASNAQGRWRLATVGRRPQGRWCFPEFRADPFFSAEIVTPGNPTAQTISVRSPACVSLASDFSLQLSDFF